MFLEEVLSLLQGFAVALSWKNLAFMFIGILLGVIIGVLPGLGGANGVAILLPLTFPMAQVPGGTVPKHRFRHGGAEGRPRRRICSSPSCQCSR